MRILWQRWALRLSLTCRGGFQTRPGSWPGPSVGSGIRAISHEGTKTRRHEGRHEQGGEAKEPPDLFVLTRSESSGDHPWARMRRRSQVYQVQVGQDQFWMNRSQLITDFNSTRQDVLSSSWHFSQIISSCLVWALNFTKLRAFVWSRFETCPYRTAE